MEKYKPQYMGKVIPANDPSKLTDFVANKYDAFSKIYDVCKEQSPNIGDIKVVDLNNADNNTLAVKLSTNKNTVDHIKEATKDNGSVNIKDDVIMAKGNK